MVVLFFIVLFALYEEQEEERSMLAGVFKLVRIQLLVKCSNVSFLPNTVENENKNFFSALCDSVYSSTSLLVVRNVGSMCVYN